jgi:hypothetical protein
LSTPAATTSGPDFEIHDYTLISTSRISRTVYENTYKVNVSNWSTGDASVSAILSGTPANVTVVRGAVTFGDVYTGETVESADTFTIRHDRSLPFDEDSLVWTVQATALPATTFGLIEKAVTAGTLDAETALLYKVYAEFNDARLPAQYRGREDGFRDAIALDAAGRRLASLSQATQDLLAPFFLSPDEPGSWYDVQAGNPTAQSVTGKPGIQAGGPLGNWDSVVVTIGGTPKARIWWNLADQARDKPRALALKAELEGYLWEKLTGAFREPVLPDDTMPGPSGSPIPNTQYHGPDGLMDIYLDYALSNLTRTRTPGCNGTPQPAWITITPTATYGHPPAPDKVVLAHELMHAIVLAYPLLSCKDDYHWMNEATAEWAEHFAYPNLNTEHNEAANFLVAPDERLNLDSADQAFGKHEYGAYLWFLNQSGDGLNSPAAVKGTWEAAASRDSIDAIDAWDGGFEKNWPTFLAKNWNRVASLGAPYRDYYKVDKLKHQAAETHHGVQKIALPVFGAARFPIQHDLLPLAAQYEHFSFKSDTRIRQYWIKNDYAGSDPRAKIYAIVKIRGQDWKKVQDWSHDQRRFFCRDARDEDLEELVLIVSNMDVASAQDFRDTVPRLGGDDTAITSPVEVLFSPLPCHDFVGSVDFATTDRSDSGDSITTTSQTTDLHLSLNLPRSDPWQTGGLSRYTATNGQVHWHAVETSAGCDTQNFSGAFPAEGELVVSLGPTNLFYALMNTSTGSTDTVTVNCEGGPAEFSFSFSSWLPQNLGARELANGDTDIDGTLEVNLGQHDGWTWHFTKAPLPPP